MSYTLRRNATIEDVVGADGFVYYNLHSKLWSVRVKGKVLAHAKYVLLADAKGKVSEAGRLRVLAEGRKNVHAGIVGKVLAIGVDAVSAALEDWSGVGEAITYNPKKYTRFVHVADESPFEGSPQVYLGLNRYVTTLA
jgi:hypothetical protein